MKKKFLNKIFPIIAGIFALMVVISLFFTFEYYRWNNDIYKTSGFKMLGIPMKDYGVLEVLLLLSVLAAGILFLLSVLRLFEKRLKTMKPFIITYMVLGSVLTALSIIILALHYGNEIVIVENELLILQSCKLYNGIGTYLYLIFSLFCSGFCITEAVLNLNKIRKKS